jgi:hypothetical protein
MVCLDSGEGWEVKRVGGGVGLMLSVHVKVGRLVGLKTR